MNRLTSFSLCIIACVMSVTLTGCGLCMKTLKPGAITDKTEKDHFIKIGEINYHYTEYPAPGDTVFMLHGFASSTYTWEKSAALLQSAGYHVYALDMKGFGWSDKPYGAKYDPFTLSAEVINFMETLSLKNTIFIGNSLGGTLAWYIALTRPDMVNKLVLIDAAGYTEKLPGLIKSAKLPCAESTLKTFFGKWLVKRILKQVLYNDDKITDAQINAYYDRMRTENALHTQVQVARGLDLEKLSEYVQQVPDITQETLIIWGKNDSWIKLDDAYTFNRNIQNSRLAIVPECGHMPMEEWPAKTADIILRFLKNEPFDEEYMPAR